MHIKVHAFWPSAGAEGSDSGTGKISKHAKLPAKNPMVRQKGGGYYRVRILKEESTRVRIGNPHNLLPSTNMLLMLTLMQKLASNIICADGGVCFADVHELCNVTVSKHCASPQRCPPLILWSGAQEEQHDGLLSTQCI